MDQRRLALDGARNFRDLGGYETLDGRRIKRAQVFRSDQLHALSDRDHQVLSGLGLRLVCDLRTADEQAQRPSRLPPIPGLKAAHLPIRPTAESEPAVLLRDGRLADIVPAEDETEPDTLAIMAGFYRSFVLDHRERWRRLFALLADDEGRPAVVHCAGGKDRTGVACALILSALGVPRETIFADYALTNHVVSAWLAELPGGEPPRFIKQIMGARREFLSAAFAAMERASGSVDGYLRDGLGVTDDHREDLKHLLLE